MKTAVAHALAVLVLLIGQSAFADTFAIVDPEVIMRGSPLIVDAYVIDVEFHTTPNSSLGYASITLSITDIIHGSAPSTIVIRRIGISDDNVYLFTEP